MHEDFNLMLSRFFYDDDDVGFATQSYCKGGPYDQIAWQNKYVLRARLNFL